MVISIFILAWIILFILSIIGVIKIDVDLSNPLFPTIKNEDHDRKN